MAASATMRVVGAFSSGDSRTLPRAARLVPCRHLQPTSSPGSLWGQPYARPHRRQFLLVITRSVEAEASIPPLSGRGDVPARVPVAVTAGFEGASSYDGRPIAQSASVKLVPPRARTPQVSAHDGIDFGRILRVGGEPPMGQSARARGVRRVARAGNTQPSPSISARRGLGCVRRRSARAPETP